MYSAVLALIFNIFKISWKPKSKNITGNIFSGRRGGGGNSTPQGAPGANARASPAPRAPSNPLGGRGIHFPEHLPCTQGDPNGSTAVRCMHGRVEVVFFSRRQIGHTRILRKNRRIRLFKVPVLFFFVLIRFLFFIFHIPSPFPLPSLQPIFFWERFKFEILIFFSVSRQWCIFSSAFSLTRNLNVPKACKCCAPGVAFFTFFYPDRSFSDSTICVARIVDAENVCHCCAIRTAYGLKYPEIFVADAVHWLTTVTSHLNPNSSSQSIRWSISTANDVPVNDITASITSSQSMPSISICPFPLTGVSCRWFPSGPSRTSGWLSRATPDRRQRYWTMIPPSTAKDFILYRFALPVLGLKYFSVRNYATILWFVSPFVSVRCDSA